MQRSPLQWLVLSSSILLSTRCATSIVEDLSPLVDVQDVQTNVPRAPGSGGAVERVGGDDAGGSDDLGDVASSTPIPNTPVPNTPEDSSPSPNRPEVPAPDANSPRPSEPPAQNPAEPEGGGAPIEDSPDVAPGDRQQPPNDTGTTAPAWWQLVWSDEFDNAGAPDPSKWTYETGAGGWGNDQAQVYTDKRQENARVENGVLIIEARKECYQGRDYTSARLVSKAKRDFQYARVEVRVKLPAARGTWPQFFMLPAEASYGQWPRSGEIDFLQHVGHESGQIHGAIQTELYNHRSGNLKSGTTKIDSSTSQFHVYAVEWTKHKVEMFADGKKYFTFTNENNGPSKWPFDRRFYLGIDLAVGGTWGGARGIDDNAFPEKLQVDYVRVFEER